MYEIRETRRQEVQSQWKNNWVLTKVYLLSKLITMTASLIKTLEK